MPEETPTERRQAEERETNEAASRLAAERSATSGPGISAPETYDRNQQMPPSFYIERGVNRFFAVEVTVDPEFFRRDSRTSRTVGSFFASWQNGLLEASESAVYAMPLDVWMLMRMAERLYYRVVTSASPEAWENYETSLPLTQIGSAPYIELKGRFESLVASPHRPEENLWRQPPGN